MSDLVLLTGATGHVGFQVLLELLKDNHRVRVAVRSPAKAEPIKSNAIIQKFNPTSDTLQYAVVPDITAAGAFDEAIKDCTYVIHVASAIPTGSDDLSPSEREAYFVKPAVEGTLEMLKAAQRSSTAIRRVVITSSVVAQISTKVFSGETPARAEPYLPSDRNDDSTHGPFDSNSTAYRASKTASLLQTEAWVEKERPNFQVVNIHPAYVIGPNLLAKTEEEVFSGTNSMALGPIMGKQFPIALPGSVCHVIDVARAHTTALHGDLAKSDQGKCVSFIVCVSAVWNDALDTVRARFPEAVKSGSLPLGGNIDTLRVDFDSSNTEKLLGSRLKGWDEQVVDIVTYYLKVKGLAAQ